MLYFLNKNKKIYIHNMNIYYVDKYLEAISKYSLDDIYLNHRILEYKEQLLSQRIFLKNSYYEKRNYYIEKEKEKKKKLDNFLKIFFLNLKNEKNKKFLQQCII